MSTTQTTRPAIATSAPISTSPAGSRSLDSHMPCDDQHALTDALQVLHGRVAVEGQDSPQANCVPAPTVPSPAGSNASRSQTLLDTQGVFAAAGGVPGGHVSGDAHRAAATGDPTPPAAMVTAPLADPLLALAADVLDDLEKVRIANENRLRQLTRSEKDNDGEIRGFGLDEAHPDVARLAALVGMLAEAEHKAVLNLQRRMRQHPLGPWAKAQVGLGEKQIARLLAAIGDPYILPEIVREDGTVEPSRPRRVSELWAYCGYHVVPADQTCLSAHTTPVGGELNGSDPGQIGVATHGVVAGVAPKRQRGHHANWSATAKMRAHLIAESCIKNRESPYRAVYDATRAKYADAVHAADCVRCGPKGKPARPGSPLSDGHKHARGLRAVAKAILRDLWREAKRIHEEAPVSGQFSVDTQSIIAADGPDLPGTQMSIDKLASAGDDAA